jgi:hypothetical protein
MFFTSKGVFRLAGLVAAAIVAAGTASSQDEKKTGVPTGNAVIWRSVNIAERDLYWGPGGREMFPDLKGARFIGRDPGGNNLKYEIEDRGGNRWIVKIADEAQPEIAATRLLWGIGFMTEIDYLVPKISIPNSGNFTNARIELRSRDIKRGDRWSWANGPLSGTPEFNGLRIMMALINNWDLKDENTIILEREGEKQYVVSDLGSSFGKLADRSMSRTGRSVNDPEDFAKAGFIKGVSNGEIEFDYRGMNENVVRGIRVEHGRWLADLLTQLSDKQIEDAFRAANYKPEEIALYTRALKARIAALDEATRNSIEN